MKYVYGKASLNRLETKCPSEKDIYALLECYTAYISSYLQTFRYNERQFKNDLECLTLEDGHD